MNSPRFKPAARTRTRTSPALGFGSGTSRCSSSVPPVPLPTHQDFMRASYNTAMPKITASPALSKLRVLDLTRVRAGPTCVRQLADFGADVIKVENTVAEDMGGPREGPDFQNLHRNKRSITLDLKSPEGKDIFLRLVKTADVVV